MVAAQAQYSPLTAGDCINGVACLLGLYRSKSIIVDSEMYSPLIDFAFYETLRRGEGMFSIENIEILPPDRVDCDDTYRKPEVPTGVKRTTNLEFYSKSIKVMEPAEVCSGEIIDLEALVRKFLKLLEAAIAGAVTQFNRVCLEAVHKDVTVYPLSGGARCSQQQVITAAQDRVVVIDATTSGLTFEKYLEAAAAAGGGGNELMFIGPVKMWNDLRLDLLKTGNLGCECREDANKVKTIDGHRFYIPSAPRSLFRVQHDATLNKDVVYAYVISRGSLAFVTSPSALPGSSVYFDILHPTIRSMITRLFGNPDTIYLNGGNVPLDTQTSIRNALDITMEMNPPYMFKGMIGSVECRYGAMRTVPGGIALIALPPTYLQ